MFKNNNSICFLQLLLVITLASCSGLIESELDIKDFVDSDVEYAMSGVLRYSSQYDTLSSKIRLSAVGINNTTPINGDATTQVFKDSDLLGDLYPTNFGGTYSTLSIDSTNYIELTPGSYLVNSLHPEYGLISAKTTIPSNLPVLYNIKIDSSTSKENAVLTFSFDDTIGDDYYHISFKNIYRNPVYDTVFTDQDTILRQRRHFPYIDNVSDNSIGIIHYHDLIFSDQNFNGGSYTITINLGFSGDTDLLSFEETIEPLNIVWSTISRDLYLFETSYANHIGNDFLGSYSEQTVIYSNVKGGIGYLGGINYRDIPLR
jgi:hypothetical protein